MKQKLEVKSAGKGRGRGVFAIAKIKKGEQYDVVPYLWVSKKDFNKMKDTFLASYWYDGFSKDKPVVIAMGFGSMYNHSEDPAATYVVNLRSKVIKYTALRNIKIGEEITIDYGYDPLA